MRRVAIPPAGGLGKGRPAAADDELRERTLLDRPFDQRRGRTRCFGLAEVVVPVVLVAPDRHEQPARSHAARVVAHSPDCPRREPGGADRSATLARALEQAGSFEP